MGGWGEGRASFEALTFPAGQNRALSVKGAGVSGQGIVLLYANCKLC